MTTAVNTPPEPTSRATPALRAAARGRRRSIVALAILVAASAGAGGWYLLNARPDAQQSSAARDRARMSQPDASPAIPVETVRLSKGGILRASTQVGSVHPFKEADLYAKVSGYLKTLDVDYGSKVKKDQVLAQIDDPEIFTEAQKAAADVAQAQAAVAQAEAFIESAKADRDAAASEVEKAKAEVERYAAMTSYHEKKLNRYKQLVQNQAIPQQLADEEEESYESSRAAELASNKEVQNAQAQLLASRARVKKAEADLLAAKANVDVAKAKKATADVMVGYTTIASPYDGVITKRNFFPGAFIRSAAEGEVTPILTVARTDKVRVITYIPDRDVHMTDIGDPAEVTLDALGTEVFKGAVSRFADALDPSSRTMHTEIDLDNPSDTIKPGMYGIAKVILDTAATNSTLPAYCLVGEAKDRKGEVFIIKDGKAKKTKVTIGADDGIRVEIRSGITPDDDVIVDVGSVSDGVPVRAISRSADLPEKHAAKSSEPATAERRHE